MTHAQARPAATVARIDDTLTAVAGGCLCGCGRPLTGSPSEYWAT